LHQVGRPCEQHAPAAGGLDGERDREVGLAGTDRRRAPAQLPARFESGSNQAILRLNRIKLPSGTFHFVARLLTFQRERTLEFVILCGDLSFLIEAASIAAGSSALTISRRPLPNRDALLGLAETIRDGLA